MPDAPRIVRAIMAAVYEDGSVDVTYSDPLTGGYASELNLTPTRAGRVVVHAIAELSAPPTPDEKCTTCGGLGHVILNHAWPEGEGPYCEKCPSCG